MLDTLLAMLAILATWSVCGAVFASIGAAMFPRGLASVEAASPAVNTNSESPDGATTWLVWFWSGWCAVVLGLQLWHFVLPIDERAAAVVASLGLLAAVWRRRQLAAQVAAMAINKRVVWVAIGVAVMWSNLATDQIRISDTGLYHMQAVRWSSAYPIVTGLGNLHGRLAFNNSALLYAAMIDIGPWSHRGHHVANGLLIVATVLPLLASATKVLSTTLRNAADSRAWIRHLARGMLLGPTLLFAYKHTTSLAPDLAGMLLVTVIGILLFDVCLGAQRTVGGAIVFVALAAATAVTIKLSLVAVSAVSVVVALRVARSPMRHWIVAAAVFAVALAPWCARGVLLSGYPAYPSQAGAFDVAWRVPNALVQDERDAIVAWARTPNVPSEVVLADSSWIGPWMLRQLGDVLNIALPLCIAVGCAGACWRLRRTGGCFERTLWLAASPFAALLAFLIVTAPDLWRFGGTSMWIVAIVANCAWLLELGKQTDRIAFISASRAAMVLAFVLVAIVGVKIVRYLRVSGGLAPIPQAELRIVTTESGLKQYVPVESDRAWDAPLPSTPYPKPRLQLRDPGNLGGGFIIRDDAR